MSSRLHIKNMVCDRCIMAVRQTLSGLGLPPAHVGLGEVELVDPPDPRQRQALADALASLGFELITDRRARTIERIKHLIIDLVHRKDDGVPVKLSTYLSEALQQDYGQLSALFSKVEGTTIEKYHIAQRIERVKELLVYDELSLTEIAHRLHYSSVAHLSTQFKKVTGLTPTHFKHIGAARRRALDQV